MSYIYVYSPRLFYTEMGVMVIQKQALLQRKSDISIITLLLLPFLKTSKSTSAVHNNRPKNQNCPLPKSQILVEHVTDNTKCGV